MLLLLHTKWSQWPHAYYALNHMLFEFIFMHLADPCIQSDLQCIQGICFIMRHMFPGNRAQHKFNIKLPLLKKSSQMLHNISEYHNFISNHYNYMCFWVESLINKIWGFSWILASVVATGNDLRPQMDHSGNNMLPFNCSILHSNALVIKLTERKNPKVNKI